MFLAGDWTKTGWPATMEGAVRSGYLAAEAVLRVEAHQEASCNPTWRQMAWWDCSSKKKKIAGKLQEAAKVTFAERQALGQAVQRFVFKLVGVFEVVVVVFGVPEVESEVDRESGKGP